MLTLIKSTLSSLPIYFMSLFFISRKVCTRLEKIQRDFLWDSGALEKKLHLVNWSSVSANMRQGGLGIRNLVALNNAIAWEVELEICYREGFFVETSHHRQIWGRGRRLVFERSEGSLWCGSVESY